MMLPTRRVLGLWLTLLSFGVAIVVAPTIASAQAAGKKDDAKKPEPKKAEETAKDEDAEEDEDSSDEDDGEDGEGDDKAAQHFAAGRKLYTEEKYKEAIGELLKAYEMRPAPPILLNVGRTYQKLGNNAKALEFYQKFMLKARVQDASRPMVEGLISKLKKEVGKKGGTGASAARGATETPGAATTSLGGGTAPVATGIQSMIHTPVDGAKVHNPITVQAELPPGTTADDVRLYFRKGGDENFRSVPMRPQGDAYVSKIDARYVTSTSLQYYLEAKSKKQKKFRGVVARAGARNNPNIVVIEGGIAPKRRDPNYKPEDIVSPYRWMFWAAVAGTAGFLGGGIAMAVVSSDRASAMETWAAERSCVVSRGCPPSNPTRPFSERARDWESEGQTFSTLSGVFFGLAAASAVGGGLLFFLDRSYVKEKREAEEYVSAPAPRFSAAPWAAPDSAGLTGRIDF